MSCGLVICSKCKREVHQNFDRTWYHCEDKSLICSGAEAVYPKDKSEITGKWCGMDEMMPEVETEAHRPKLYKQYKKRKRR